MFLAEIENATIFCVLGGIVLAVIIVIGWFISTANGLRRMDVKCNEANSGIDVALTKRHDALKKLYQVTKGYSEHEKETLAKVIAMRQPAASAPMNEKSEYSNMLTSALSSMNVVVERYPELKADKSFNKLQDAISEVEENLQAARRLYNSNVSQLNQKIVSFPASLVAKLRNIVKRDFFEATAEEKQDVDLTF